MTLVASHFNSSTLKVSYNPSTKKVRVLNNCPNCHDPACPKGHESSGTVCGDDIPSSLCATIYGIKRCSDDSVIAAQNVCLSFEHNYYGCICWSATIEIDGKAVTVLYKTGVNCAGDADGYIYDDSDVWFKGFESHPCVDVGSDLTVGDCGNSERVWDCEANYVWRDVVAYGGRIDICNPNNAEEW